MNIVVNGNPQHINESCTVRELLEASGMGDSPCAVEVNKKLVPRKQHEQRRLQEGDRVEIVTLVGGG